MVCGEHTVAQRLYNREKNPFDLFRSKLSFSFPKTMSSLQVFPRGGFP